MTDTIETIETEWIPLPDGTRLSARIWLPAGARDLPAPAVLEFLPYRRRDVTAPRDESTYPYFAQQGIAGVRVDLRGTGDSDGFFDDEYSETELADAEAVIAWIADQPWCSGKVGMMGISWGGFNALQLAARRPPALGAVISIASTVDRFADDIHYKGGCHLSAQVNWATTMLMNISRPPDAAVVGEDWRRQWLARLERQAPLIETWLSHQRRDDFWRHGSICEDFSALDAPALVIAGTADGYRNTPWLALAGLGAPNQAITGPWIHKYPHFARPRPCIDFLGEAVNWWRRWLSVAEAGSEDQPVHRLYLSEAVRPGVWRDSEPGRWVALDGASGAPLRLHLTGDGRLARSASPDSDVTVHTRQDCGADGGEYFAVNPGPDLPGDQRADDALSVCFETGPLDKAVEVIGPPVLRLPVRIDAATGNLVARLVDVHPDGTAHRVSLGVLNLAHRKGSASPRPMNPGQVETIELKLDVTGYRFLPGHRIRLALATSYFPYILPPPSDVTAVVTTGAEAWLDLPSAGYQEIDMPTPPGRDTLPAYPADPTGSADRRVSRSFADGRTTVTVTDDTGQVTHPENGMTWRERRRSDWSIAPDDPLRFEGREHFTAMRRRNGVTTETIATARLTATAGDWVVESELTARLDGEVVFSRSWQRNIPRDLM